MLRPGFATANIHAMNTKSLLIAVFEYQRII